MSTRTRSDICQNVCHLGNINLQWKDYDLSFDWFNVYSACPSGKRERLLSDVFAKVYNDKLYSVHLVNSSPYANGGDYDWTIFTEKDQQEIIDHKLNDLLDEACLLPDTTGIFPASELESVELFLKDYGLQKDILDTDSVNQTL